jgi:hypothetical protein
MNETRLMRSELLAYLLVSFLAICAYKILMTAHLPNMEALISAAKGVTEGKPHWIAYQNRLLGPYVILTISMLGVSFKTAWLIYHELTLQVFCVLIFWILRREGLAYKDAFANLIYILFAFLALQHNWFYTWDSIDIIIFTAFAYGILKAAPTRLFLVLFVIGILNRESALFIGAYLVLNSLTFSTGKIIPKLTNYKSIVTGSALLVAGALYTKTIRHALFVSKPDGLPDARHELIGNHVYFLSNLKSLFFINFTNRNYYISVFILFAVFYFAGKYRKMNDNQIKLFLISMLLIFNILVFGILIESRMLFILLPFFLLLWLSVTNQFRVSLPR